MCAQPGKPASEPSSFYEMRVWFAFIGVALAKVCKMQRGTHIRMNAKSKVK